MKRSYIFFNIICILVIGVAGLGTVWFGRGYIRAVLREKEKADIPIAISRIQIEKIREEKFTSSSVLGIASTSLSFHSTVTSSPSEKSVPPSINLDVPFVPQAPEKNWDQPWQDACEEAAILMIDAYYKDIATSVEYDKNEILKMVAWEESEERNWERSIEIEKIKKIFTEYLKLPSGKKITILENPTVEQIKKYVGTGHPVYVVADGKTLPNPHFQNGGPAYHALVVRGYTETHFITNDPGTQFGENFKYKYNDLMESIRDWNGGDVKSGRRVVLVIE